MLYLKYSIIFLSFINHFCKYLKSYVEALCQIARRTQCYGVGINSKRFNIDVRNNGLFFAFLTNKI